MRKLKLGNSEAVDKMEKAMSEILNDTTAFLGELAKEESLPSPLRLRIRTQLARTSIFLRQVIEQVESEEEIG